MALTVSPLNTIVSRGVFEATPSSQSSNVIDSYLFGSSDATIMLRWSGESGFPVYPLTFDAGSTVGQSVTLIATTSNAIFTIVDSNLVAGRWTSTLWAEVTFIWTGGIWTLQTQSEPSDGNFIEVPSYDPTKWKSSAQTTTLNGGTMVLVTGRFTSLIAGNTEIIGIFPFHAAPGSSWSVVGEDPPGTVSVQDLGTSDGVHFGITPVWGLNGFIYTNFIYPRQF